MAPRAARSGRARRPAPERRNGLRSRLAGPPGALPTGYPPLSMAESQPTHEKSGIPPNPGRRDLGMKATLLFPSR